MNSTRNSSPGNRGNGANFPVPILFFGWVGAFVVANIFAAVIFGASGAASGEEPIWVVGLVAVALWAPLIAVLVMVSKRMGSGNFMRDYSVGFRAVDLAGIPIGVASQLLLVNLVYWPLRELFPSTFDVDKVEDRARGLFDRADGAWIVVLVLVVVVGAPIVEELVYRGFIHSGLRSRMNDAVALVVAAAWFALVHMQLAELPGLFAFGLVLGTCYHRTRRVGMPIVAHMAFNATGILFLVLT